MRLNFQPRTVIINLITALTLALLLEVLLWLGLTHPSTIPGFMEPLYQKYYLSEDRDILQVSPCGRYDSSLFYMLRTGPCSFVNREFNVLNQINSAGLRDEEESLHRPSIVVFGDSFTLGWGVDQDKSFPQLLEELTQQKVLNAGMSSFGTAREMLLKERLDLSQVQTIIIQYHPNDYEENQKFIGHNFQLEVRSRESYDSLSNVLSQRVRYYPFKHLMGISKSFAHRLIKQEENVNDTIQARAFLRILQHFNIHEHADEIIVFKVDKHGKNTDHFENAVDYLLSIEFKNMKIRTARISTALDKSDYFILDDHINANGHGKIARQLRKFMKVPASPILVEK